MIHIVEYIDRYEEDLKALVGSLDFNFDRGYLLFEDKRPIGFSAYSLEDRRAELFIFIAEDKRRRGNGSYLLEETLTRLKVSSIDELVVGFDRELGYHQFFIKNGFKSWWPLEGMRREPEAFDLDRRIVAYDDIYFQEAFKIHEESFHKMRLSIGMESEIREAGQEDRDKWWAKRDYIFLLIDSQELVGVIILTDGDLDRLAIKDGHQGKGYGRIMVEFGLNYQYERARKESVLWCLSQNPAQKLYEKMGFEVFVIKDFFKISLSEG